VTLGTPLLGRRVVHFNYVKEEDNNTVTLVNEDEDDREEND